MDFRDKLRHLSSKVVDSLIDSQKKERESSDTTNNSTTTHNLQEREMAGLQITDMCYINCTETMQRPTARKVNKPWQF